jgi:hypothetical protein
MAAFNWHIGSYRKGRATSQSNYIWRRDTFSGRDDLVAAGCGNLPGWSHEDPAVFFAAADLYERQNGSACRHLVVALPRELSHPQHVSLVEKLIARDIGAKPHQYAIHSAPEQGGEHPHAHIVYSDRVPDEIDRPADAYFRRSNAKSPALGGCRKDSGGQTPRQLQVGIVNRKKLWADLQNEALGAAGHAARVDHRSGEWKPGDEETEAD